MRSDAELMLRGGLARPLPAGRPGRSVLVIDQRRSLLNTIAAALERAGCSPVVTASAEEGWLAVLIHPIELVVASHSLPRMKGAELVRRLRASQVRQRRDLPVIGLADDLTCEAALRSVRVDSIIRAPYRETAILRAIRAVADAYWFR